MFLSIVLDLHILNLCEFLHKPDFNYSRIHHIISVIRIVMSSFTVLLTAANIARRFKRPPKQQNRRRNGILFKTPSFVSTPDSFFPANWPPLQEASQLFPVRVLYYIILVNCNITKYT